MNGDNVEFCVVYAPDSKNRIAPLSKDSESLKAVSQKNANLTRSVNWIAGVIRKAGGVIYRIKVS